MEATSTILLELRRGNLLLRCGQFVVDLSIHIQQACRRRLLELESKRAADLKLTNPPRVPRSLLSTSTSIVHQPMVLPDLGAYSADSDTQGMYSLREISKSPERGVAGVYEIPKRLNLMIRKAGRGCMMILRLKMFVYHLLSGNGNTIKLLFWATVVLPRRRRRTFKCSLLPHPRRA